MKSYLKLLRRVANSGIKDHKTRGQPTIQSFGESITVRLQEGLPILTTKRISIKNIIGEMLWFISGRNTINDLQKHNINFWNDWADDQGRVESYGRYWRYLPLSNHEQVNHVHGAARCMIDGKPYLSKSSEFVSMGDDGKPYFDQLAYVYKTLQRSPGSRRIKLDQWVPQNAFASNLPPCPCHLVFNTQPHHKTDKARVLNLQVWQRSADVPIGVPYNLAVYGLFATCLAKDLGLNLGELQFSFTNAHIYQDQLEQAKEQITRIPKSKPVLREMPDTPLLDWDLSNIDDIKIDAYDPHPPIYYPVQV